MFRYTTLLTALLLTGARAQQPAQHPDHMEHRFDNPAELAKQFDDPARDAWQMPDRVIAALALKPGAKVADIGSGTGYFSVRLARSAAHPTVYGSDIEDAMVSYLKERAEKEHLPNIISVKASADSPNLTEPVDLVLIVDTWHHVGSRSEYVKHLATSLRPGGRIAIVDFRADSPEGPPKEFRLSPGQVDAEMKKGGYHLVASYDFLPRQFFVIFAR